MSVQLLQAHWGFTRMPFGRDLAPSMLHRHHAHAEAVARISWCIEQHHIGVLIGEVGAGKTVAVRAAVAALDASRHVPIYIANPAVGVRGLLTQIVAALGAVPSFYTATLVTQAFDALAGEQAERGRTPVLIIDEGHLLDHPQMEAVRMMSNHQMDSVSPMATLLVGQPSLRQKMRLSTLAALEQRIGMRYTMPPMSDTETREYLHHHIRLAGRADTLFTDDAITVIHTASRGYPRAVNNIAVYALTAAYARGNPIVDEKAARAALTETMAD
jgi:type II secretory pathway predicted ATPase ExeA